MQLNMRQIARRICLNSSDPFTFIVIGCGGTGGFLVRDLARMIVINNVDRYEKARQLEIERGRSNVYTRRVNNHRLVLIDGDIVEEKNISRQNFIAEDIGRNKAEVLAERYSNAYAMDIAYYDKYIENDGHLRKLINEFVYEPYYSIPVIIGCVDNNSTRSIIAKVVQLFQDNRQSIFWIDSGNEEFSGQVVMGCEGSYSLKSIGGSEKNSRCAMPVVTQAFPEMLNKTDKHPNEMSCDDRAVSAPQSIVTNINMAAIILSFCNYFINMPDRSIKTWAVYVNTEDISTSTKYLTSNEAMEASEKPIWTPPKISVSPNAGSGVEEETAATEEELPQRRYDPPF